MRRVTHTLTAVQVESGRNLYTARFAGVDLTLPQALEVLDRRMQRQPFPVRVTACHQPAQTVLSVTVEERRQTSTGLAVPASVARAFDSFAAALTTALDRAGGR